MFETLKKLKYGARVLLSRSGGQPEVVNVNGRSTVVMQNGDGPPFIYLHSTLGEAAMWLPFLQTWSKQFRVIVPTHPGFGQSGGFDEIDTIEDMAFHYIELLDILGLEQVCLGGCSLGGWIAAEVACRWPERVKKLWIADAPGLWVPEQPLPDMFRHVQNKEMMRELLFHDPKSAMATLVIKDKQDEQTMMAAYQSLTVLARLIWERPYDPKLAKRLHRIQCPTLLVWGASDKLVPPAYGEAYRRQISGSRLELIPNCGHLPMFEKEAEFVEIIASFCKDA
ncbi:MAG TPA: alpha/beta hydrolase [Gemmataceae bacterium]|nr:alpha/beta hydrolase [Gemmataceae bacterium]